MSESSPSNSELREVAVAYRTSIDERLERPVAPDFVSHPPRMTPDEYVAWGEEMRTLFPERQDSAEKRAKARCAVEFVT